MQADRRPGVVTRLLVGLGPAIVAVVGLNTIFGTAWSLSARIGVAVLWLAAVMLLAWFAMYRWGDEKQRRDIANVTSAAGRLIARLRGGDPGSR